MGGLPGRVERVRQLGVNDAVVRRPGTDGATPSPVVAFATLWAGDRLRGASAEASTAELSIDLVQFDREAAPPGVVEALFAHVMAWGAAEGYGWFSLRMAPLSGLEPGGRGGSRALAPLWNRAGALLFRHGEHVYNLQGLRAYKGKFGPEWEPRYLCVPPSRLALAAALVDVTARIAGGMGGLVKRRPASAASPSPWPSRAPSSP